MEAMAAASIASTSLMPGKIPGKRLANIVLPVPGGGTKACAERHEKSQAISTHILPHTKSFSYYC